MDECAFLRYIRKSKHLARDKNRNDFFTTCSTYDCSNTWRNIL